MINITLCNIKFKYLRAVVSGKNELTHKRAKVSFVHNVLVDVSHVTHIKIV